MVFTIVNSAMENQAAFVRRTHIQGHFRRLYEGYVMVDMTDGSVEGDREAVGTHHVGYHAFHVTVVEAGFVVGELPDNQAFEPTENSTQPELLQNAFNFVNRLCEVFDEQDYAVVDHVERRADQVGYDSHVSAPEDACRGAGAIERVAVENIGRTFAAEDAEKSRVVAV